MDCLSPDCCNDILNEDKAASSDSTSRTTNRSWDKCCCSHTDTITVKSDKKDHEKTTPGVSGQRLPTVLHHHRAESARKERCTTKGNLDHLDRNAISISVSPDNNEITGHNPNGLEFNKVDVEMALFEVEHISIRVQGMDCTGCEKKLYKALSSLVELSNIKTSLLLAQAEFDLIPSKSIDGNKIIRVIEKMTGFMCSKIVHQGAELELIFENMPTVEADMWPVGVSNLTIVKRDRLLVTYDPKIIGARDLLSEDYFQCAKLAPPSHHAQVSSGTHQLRRTCRKTMLSIICTIPVLILSWAKLPKHEVLYGAISLGFATTIQVVVAGQFYARALNSLLFSRMIDMDLLIVLSSSAAYFYSVVSFAYLSAGNPQFTRGYFETSTLLVTLIMVGRAVTDFARQRAMESITIESLQTPTAIIVDPNSDKETEIDARLLQYDDLFKVLPDSSIVTDGLIVSGESDVDEAMITGEATLVSKTSGMPIIAGSVNHSGAIIAQVTRLPGENTISIIGAMVNEVKSSKPGIQELADRVAGYFTPAILGLAFIVFILWEIIGRAIQHQSTAVASINAMTFSISVLIVSCPCAIGLAVPMVVVIASSVAARHGLIFKTAETIDLARNISHVVFDKTGTLTQGNLQVKTEEYPMVNRDSLTSMILGLVTNSNHPVSKAISAYFNSLGVQISSVYDLKIFPGNGIEASWNNLPVRAGNPYWLGIKDCPEVCRMFSGGLTMFCVTLNGELVAAFGLEDQIRPDALETITELKKRSIDISILSGDNEASVSAIATRLDIPLSSTRACCSPEEKQAYVKSLLGPNHLPDHTQCNGSKCHSFTHHQPRSQSPIVLFIGDGSNDAPSLAIASIGLHLNDSTSLTAASAAADAVLLRPSLSKILTLIDLSRAFHRRVIFNFVWSAVYNLIAVILAAGVIPKARIPPAYAGLGEAVSIIPVLGVAVGLKFLKP